MELLHFSVANKTEEEAEKFYSNFLKLKKISDFIIPEKITEEIFGLTKRVKVIKYQGNNYEIEVFILDKFKLEEPLTSHVCFSVEKFDSFIEKAKEMGIEIVTSETKEKVIYFVKDFSGNLFEIKGS